MRMMMKAGTPLRYMAMTAPDLMDWVPMSLGSKPSMDFPSRFAEGQNLVRTVDKVMVVSCPLTRMALMLVSDVVPE